MSLEGKQIGFIGGGAMAEALAGGLIAAGIAPSDILVADLAAARREHLAARLGVRSWPLSLNSAKVRSKPNREYHTAASCDSRWQMAKSCSV